MSRFTLVKPQEDYAKVFKTFTADADGGGVKSTSTKPGSTCVVEYADFSDFDGMVEALERVQRERTHYIIRGELRDDADLGKVIKRRYKRATGSLAKMVADDADDLPLRAEPRDWVMLDIDGLPMPSGMDPRKKPLDVIEHVINQLPRYFHGASCWWQFSASQSVPGAAPVIKVHLFYLLDRAVSDESLRRWASTHKSTLKIDPAPFSANQPHFVAAPEFIDMKNPLRVRSGVVRTDQERVTFDLSQFPAAAAPVIHFQQKKVLNKYLKNSLGDGLFGFHDPIKSAIGGVIKAIGPAVHRESLKSQIREAVDAAPKAASRKTDEIERYKSDEFLDPLIEAIAGREEASRAEAQTVYTEIRDSYVYVKSVEMFYDTRQLLYASKIGITQFHSAQLPKVADMLLADADLRRVDRVTYKPGADELCQDEDPESGVTFDAYNMYRPYALPLEDVKLAKPFVDHLQMLCEESYDIVTDWLAFNVQKPGEKILYALLVQGGQGTGKSALSAAMAAVMGRSAVREVTVDEIDGPFTSWAKAKRMVVIEEVRDTSERFRLYNRLKSYITSPVLMLNEKNVKATSYPNRMNIMAFTNYEDAIPIDDDDRRFLIHFSKMKPQPSSYYDRLYACIEQHPGAILSFLMQRDVSKFKPKSPAPMTDSKRDVMSESGPPFAVWFKEAYAHKDWPLGEDLVVVRDLRAVLPPYLSRVSDMTITTTMRRAGCVKIGVRRLPHGIKNVWALRNVEHYKTMNEADIANVYKRPVRDEFSKMEGYQAPPEMGGPPEKPEY